MEAGNPNPKIIPVHQYGFEKYTGLWDCWQHVPGHIRLLGKISLPPINRPIKNQSMNAVSP